MIHGPTMWRAKANRTAEDARTSAVNHAHPGAATSLLRTDADLAQPLGDLGQVVDAWLGSGLRHAQDDRVVGRGTAGGGFQRRHVRVGNAAEIVLAHDVGARGGAERGSVIGG